MNKNRRNRIDVFGATTIGDITTLRKLVTYSLTLLVLVVLPSQSPAQNIDDLVFEVYVASVAYPENFDSYIQQNQNLFTDQFVNYVTQLTTLRCAAGQQHSQYCDTLFHDPVAWRNCINQNIDSQLCFWCNSLFQSLSGSAWANTLTGQGCILTKQMLGSQAYTDLVMATIPLVRPYF